MSAETESHLANVLSTAMIVSIFFLLVESLRWILFILNGIGAWFGMHFG